MVRRHAAVQPGASAVSRAGGGLLDRAEEGRGLQPRQRYCDSADGHRDRPDRDRGAGSDQVDVLPAVPVRGWLRRRPAVLPRSQQGRAKADPVLGDRAVVVPADPIRVRAHGRTRRGIRGRTLCRIPDDLRVDRRCDRPDEPPAGLTGATTVLAQRDPGRLRRFVHLRHGRVRDRAGPARTEAHRRRSTGRLRRVRAADGRWPGRPRPRSPVGLPPDRGTGISNRCRERTDREARARAVPGAADLRREDPARQRVQRRDGRYHPAAGRHRRDLGSTCGSRRAGRSSRSGSQRSRAARRCCGHRRRVRAEQGDQSAHVAGNSRRAVFARSLSAEDHAQPDRDPRAAGDRDPARRRPDDRRQRAARGSGGGRHRSRRSAGRKHGPRRGVGRNRGRWPDRRARCSLGCCLATCARSGPRSATSRRRRSGS
jgi:hypothetical protein